MNEPQYLSFTNVLTIHNVEVRFSFGDYDGLCAAWESGKPEFYDGENEWGDSVKLRVSLIQSITHVSHEARVRWVEEFRLQEKADKEFENLS